MMRKKVELVAVFLALSIFGCSTRQLIGVSASTEWTPSTYPNPTVDTKACGRRGVRSWVCDPDGLLSYNSANVVEGTLKEIAAAEDPFVSAGCKKRGPGDPKGYQVRGPSTPGPRIPCIGSRAIALYCCPSAAILSRFRKT
jgi:hypothetical protein